MDSSTPYAPSLDRYVIDQYLAEGGMGAIYLGKKLGAGGFEKQVVLKQLLPEFTKQPEFIDLFLREARLSATLDHANITHTIDLVSTGDDHFIVMEFVDGDDLRALFKKAKKRKQRLSAGAAIFVAQEILSALAYAHQKCNAEGDHLKLIHRDISPSNILVSRNGEVKLTDFGIAKAATHNSVFYRVKGKVGYMSPEQAKSEVLDPRSDLYSLAVCLYEIITGERLFVAQGITTSAEELYSQEVPKVSEKSEDAPAALDDIMKKALALKPDDRYQSAGEFQEALLRCAHASGLLMSSPTLAEHLHKICYREISHTAPPSEQSFDEGTEMFPAHEGTEQLNAHEISSISSVDGMVWVEGKVIPEREQKFSRGQTGITQLDEFQGKQLTSIIGPDMSSVFDEGADPLSEFEEFESLSDFSEIEATRRHAPKESAFQRVDPNLATLLADQLDHDPATARIELEHDPLPPGAAQHAPYGKTPMPPVAEAPAPPIPAPPAPLPYLSEVAQSPAPAAPQLAEADRVKRAVGVAATMRVEPLERQAFPPPPDVSVSHAYTDTPTPQSTGGLSPSKEGARARSEDSGGSARAFPHGQVIAFIVLLGIATAFAVGWTGPTLDLPAPISTP